MAIRFLAVDFRMMTSYRIGFIAVARPSCPRGQFLGDFSPRLDSSSMNGRLLRAVVVVGPVFGLAWMPHGPSGLKSPHDGDYGCMLDKVYGKGWCALQDSNLRPPGS
jgi:hypothetical protein